ncbi:ATP-binding protein [Sneathiella aquimaris]|uniref:ATP-binding protein n=1 Tax=Sneathiella aquimaris TaxID=2599305 RepID=UPI00146BF6FF|nr:ATP-binding protein [Sneathiella aquimaris]
MSRQEKHWHRPAMLEILQDVSPVQETMLCRDVAEFFRQRETVRGVAVLRSGVPVGVISRDELIIKMATQYGHAVYGKRPVSELMDTNPLIVDVQAPLDDVERCIANGYPQALLSGFVIIRDGLYLGMGTGLSLLRAGVERTRVRNADLVKISQQAQQANQMKTQFLANMSHELRTPLNAVIGFSELIASEAYGKLEEPRYKDYAQDILDSGRHLLSMINDILDMSKIEAGRYELQENSVDLNRLTANVVKMCHVLAVEKGVHLGCQCKIGTPILRADERAFKQMLLNLISNAIKYTPPGGTVLVECQELQSGDLQIDVIDTGVGIPKAMTSKMLEPFAQAGTDINNKTQGTGLGLPIVKALAELHQVSFQLISEADAGTTARLVVPQSRVEWHYLTSAASAGVLPPKAAVISCAN